MSAHDYAAPVGVDAIPPNAGWSSQCGPSPADPRKIAEHTRSFAARIISLAAATFIMVQQVATAADLPTGWTNGLALPSLPDALRKITDTGGWRSKLEQAGVQLTLTYYGDAFANPWGGVKQGLGYDGRFAAIIDADLSKLIGWSGAKFHTSLHFIHGTQFSTINLQNLALVSGIEAPPSARLFNLWIEQNFGSNINLRLGQFGVGQEFVVSPTAGLFVNAAFGWPVLPAVNLPSGGPAYPEATPAVRLTWKPNDQVTFRAAIFNGDPAGPGNQNPVYRDPYGVAFRVNDPPLLITELAFAHNQDRTAGQEHPHEEGIRAQRRTRDGHGRSTSILDLPGSIKIGGWLHTAQFADQRYNTQGGLLAISGTPLMHSGNVTIYGLIDQMLWRNGERELNAFLRVAGTPRDRNFLSYYVDTGFSYKGPIDARPDDLIGFAVSYSRVSPQAAAYDLDLEALTGSPMPIRNYETAVELTYQMQLADDWYVQPTLQYIINPGGHVPNPADPSGRSAIPNAFVVGLRTFLSF